jgi:outer membrane protein TolC
MENKQMRYKVLLLLSALAFFAQNLWADTTLTIDSAVQLAQKNNLSLERSRTESAAAKRKSDRSWNSLLPSLGAGLIATHPTSLTDPIPAAQDEWKEGFTLSAGLQISPAIAANVSQARAEYEAGLLNYEAARRELDYNVRGLYYQLLLLKANAELAGHNAKSAEDRHAQTVARQRAGQASNLDELSARLDMQTQAISFQNAEIAYENALDSFKNLLMIPPEETIVLEGSLEDFAVTENGGESAGAAPLSNESTEMGVLRKSIEVLEKQKKAAQTSAYAPTLNLAWNSMPLYSGNSGRLSDSSGQFSVTLSVKLDNFLPWSPVREQIDSLNDSIAAQQSLLRESSLNHQNTLQRLSRNITQSLRTIETLRLNITLAEETYASYETAYRSGAVDLQSLNTARDSLAAAENKLLSEQYNLALAVLEFKKEANVPD